MFPVPVLDCSADSRAVFVSMCQNLPSLRVRLLKSLQNHCVTVSWVKGDFPEGSASGLRLWSLCICLASSPSSWAQTRHSWGDGGRAISWEHGQIFFPIILTFSILHFYSVQQICSKMSTLAQFYALKIRSFTSKWHLLEYLSMPERWPGYSRPGGDGKPGKKVKAICNYSTYPEHCLTSSIAATVITVLIKSKMQKFYKMRILWAVSWPEASCLEVTGDRGQYRVIWRGGGQPGEIYTLRGGWQWQLSTTTPSFQNKTIESTDNSVWIERVTRAYHAQSGWA